MGWPPQCVLHVGRQDVKEAAVISYDAVEYLAGMASHRSWQVVELA